MLLTFMQFKYIFWDCWLRKVLVFDRRFVIKKTLLLWWRFIKNFIYWMRFMFWLKLRGRINYFLFTSHNFLFLVSLSLNEGFCCSFVLNIKRSAVWIFRKIWTNSDLRIYYAISIFVNNGHDNTIRIHS